MIYMIFMILVVTSLGIDFSRMGTMPQANSIRSGPEGAQGVLGFDAFSLSFIFPFVSLFSSVSSSSIFDL